MKDKTKIYNEVVIDMNTGETISENYEYVDTKDVAQCKKAVKKVETFAKGLLGATVGNVFAAVGAIPTIWGGDKWWQRNPYGDDSHDSWDFVMGNAPGNDQMFEYDLQYINQLNNMKGDYGTYQQDRAIAGKSYNDALSNMRMQMESGQLSGYEAEVANRNAQQNLKRQYELARTTQNDYIEALKTQWNTTYGNIGQTEYAQAAGLENQSASYLDAYKV